MNNTVLSRRQTSLAQSLWSVLGLVTLTGITYLLFLGYIVPGVVELSAKKVQLQQVGIGNAGLILAVALVYVLVASVICLAVNIFKPLKSHKEEGLILTLIMCFIWGIVFGILLGLFAGVGEGFFEAVILFFSGALLVCLFLGIAGGLLVEFGILQAK